MLVDPGRSPKIPHDRDSSASSANPRHDARTTWAARLGPAVRATAHPGQLPGLLHAEIAAAQALAEQQAKAELELEAAP